MYANERESQICLILSFCFISYIIYASHRSLCCFLIIYSCRNTPLRQILNVQKQFCVFFDCFAQLYFNFYSSDVKASTINVRTSRKAPIIFTFETCRFAFVVVLLSMRMNFLENNEYERLKRNN